MKCEDNIHPVLNTLEGSDAAILFSGQWGNDKPKRTWISQFLHIKSFIIQKPPHPQQHMQWLSPAIYQCKSNTLSQEEQGVRLGEKSNGVDLSRIQLIFLKSIFLLGVHSNLNQNWAAVLGTMALCHSCPTTKISSVSKPYCPLAAQPSWAQPLPAATARTWPLCTALIHPSSSQGWETDAFRLPAWSVTVCLASASSFPTPDVSTWCCSKLCQASSQQGMYLLLLLQRWLWCSVFYSFLPDPPFCSPLCTLLPTQDLFFNFL